jgi:hypothetical protein
MSNGFIEAKANKKGITKYKYARQFHLGGHSTLKTMGLYQP